MTDTVGRHERWWDHLWRDKVVLIGSALLVLLALAAVFAPLFAGKDPTFIDPGRRLLPPSGADWLGTDRVGRDLFARALFGARVSLSIGALVALSTLAVGVVLGLIAGYVRFFGPVIMRVMDGMMAIPAVLFGIATVVVFGASTLTLVIAIGLPSIPDVVRLTRSLVLTIRTEPFIEAATMAGTRTPMIMLRHMLPNTISPLIVLATYTGASAVLAEAALSFLGVGTPPELPSWGNMIAEGRTSFQIAPWVVFVPGAFLAITVLAINLVGDGLRDALDPLREVGR